MADYTGTTLPPLEYPAPSPGLRPGFRTAPLVYEPARAYGSVPSGSGGRPLTGQLFPRGLQ